MLKTNRDSNIIGQKKVCYASLYGNYKKTLSVPLVFGMKQLEFLKDRVLQSSTNFTAAGFVDISPQVFPMVL